MVTNIERKVCPICGDQDLWPPRSLSQAKFVEDVRITSGANSKDQIRLLDLTSYLLDDHSRGEDVIGPDELDVILVTRTPDRLLNGLVRLSLLVARRVWREGTDQEGSSHWSSVPTQGSD